MPESGLDPQNRSQGLSRRVGRCDLKRVSPVLRAGRYRIVWQLTIPLPPARLEPETTGGPE